MNYSDLQLIRQNILHFVKLAQGGLPETRPGKLRTLLINEKGEERKFLFFGHQYL